MRSSALARLLCIGLLAVGSAWAQPAPRSADAGGPAWASLTPAQRGALAPLEREWATIEPSRKQKWLDIAARFPKMPPEERARAQERMSAWARLTPQERGQARLQFQQARELMPEERQARWEAYQALSPEQRQQLAERAAPQPKAAPSRAESPKSGRRVEPAPKTNIVPSPAVGAAPKAVAPTVVQARPGATTTLVTKPATPPLHQQTGLPKIAATPGFVDSTTLLPKRGPQGAATSSDNNGAKKPRQP